MNKTSHIIKTISTLLVCASMFSTCIKENFSDCPENIRVYFDFDDRSGENHSKHIDQMNLYVFNDKGLFLHEYSEDSINFDSDYYINCSDLYPGKFRFIAWAGKDKNSYSIYPEPFVRNKTTIMEAFVMLNQADDCITEVVHPLFYSVLPATVTKTKEQYFSMPLELMTNTVIVRTIGLPSDNDDYTFEINDNHGYYQFDGSFGSNDVKGFYNEDIKYVAPCLKNEMNQIRSSINILRLSANRKSPQMQIFNKTAGRPLYPNNNDQTGNLIDLIKKANPNIDFNNTHTYDIVLNFEVSEDTNLDGLTIIINGWVVREQESDLYD